MGSRVWGLGSADGSKRIADFREGLYVAETRDPSWDSRVGSSVVPARDGVFLD